MLNKPSQKLKKTLLCLYRVTIVHTKRLGAARRTRVKNSRMESPGRRVESGNSGNYLPYTVNPVTNRLGKTSGLHGKPSLHGGPHGTPNAPPQCFN